MCFLNDRLFENCGFFVILNHKGQIMETIKLAIMDKSCGQFWETRAEDAIMGN
jgi:hypothetical protein